MYPFWVGISILLFVIYVHWIGYFVPNIGCRLRRVTGPWLMGFSEKDRNRVILRDSFSSLGFSLFFVTFALRINTTWLLILLGISVFFVMVGAVYADKIDHIGRESKVIYVFLREVLSHKELVSWLAKYGALIGGKQHLFVGRLEKQSGFIWIYHFVGTRRERSEEELNRLSSEERERMLLLNAIETKLDGKIGTELQITVSVIRKKMLVDSRDVMGIICDISRTWPCVVLDAEKAPISGEQICGEFAEGRNRVFLVG